MSGNKRKLEQTGEVVGDQKGKKVATDSGNVPTVSDEQIQRIKSARDLVFRRDAARAEGKFDVADEIRESLNSLGVELYDQKGGPSGWKFKDGTPRKLPAGYSENINSSKKEVSAVQNVEASLKQNSSSETSKNSAPVKNVKVTEQSAKPVSAKTTSSKPAAGQGKTVQQADGGVEQQRNRAALDAIIHKDAGNGTRNIQGMLVTDNQIGTGETATRGSRVKVHYIGKLKSNGRVFDKSKKPFAFTIGRGEVIRGWDLGVEGMKIGGKRNLIIPATLAYGKSGAPPTIPANATLVFDVALLEVR
jgi:FKBP-type peptidyl-prolyl cis-trans isomerase